MSSRDLWAESKTDGERHIAKKCAEYADHAAHMAADLKRLAQVKDADGTTIKRLVQVSGELGLTAERLKDLGGT